MGGSGSDKTGRLSTTAKENLSKWNKEIRSTSITQRDILTQHQGQRIIDKKWRPLHILTIPVSNTFRNYI